MTEREAGDEPLEEETTNPHFVNNDARVRRLLRLTEYSDKPKVLRELLRRLEEDTEFQERFSRDVAGSAQEQQKFIAEAITTLKQLLPSE